MSSSCKQKSRGGFTLVELLVVIGIIAVLIGILLPSLQRAREQANTARCLSNLRQIGIAIVAYSVANKNYLVPGNVQFSGDPAEGRDDWATILVAQKYLPAPAQEASTTGNSIGDISFGESVFRCPSGNENRKAAGSPNALAMEGEANSMFWRLLSAAAPRGVNPGMRIDRWYATNSWFPSNNTDSNMVKAYDKYPFTRIPGQDATYVQQLHKLNQLKSPTTLILIYDGMWSHEQNINNVSARHNKKTQTNAVFVDGHAESVPVKHIKSLVEPGAAPVGGALKKFVATEPHFILRPN